MGHLPDSGAQVLHPGPNPEGQVPGWHMADSGESKEAGEDDCTRSRTGGASPSGCQTDPGEEKEELSRPV